MHHGGWYEAARESITTILSKITSLGGSLRIFRVSVEEMTRSAKGLLQRPQSERTGPTARALQQNEVVEAFVRQVATSPDGILGRFGIRINEQNLDQFPNEHKYFSDELVKNLYSKINCVEGGDARWHDTSIATLIMRKRAGFKTSDLFSARHVLITRNPFFGPVTRRFNLDNALINSDHVGPVVHHRDFATSVWLRVGLGASDQEVPRKFILSACQRVLSLNRSVVNKARESSRNMTDSQKQQLELLLNEGRAVQVLMDKTLGAAHIIDSTNIDALVSEMKNSLNEELRAQTAAQIGATKAEARRKTIELTKKIAEFENRIADEREKSSAFEDKISAIIGSLVHRSNIRSRKMRRLSYIVFFFMFLVSQIASYSTNLLTGTDVVILSIFGITTAGLVQFIKTLRERFLDPFWTKCDWRYLEGRALDIGIDDIRDRVSYDNGMFSIQTNGPSASAPVAHTASDLLSPLNPPSSGAV